MQKYKKPIKKTEILKVIVGSVAHGTANKDSDTDFRSVYIEPSSQLLEIGYKSKGVSWVEGETEDQTAYELGTFINAVLNGKPNELEMLVAPVVEQTIEGEELRFLFPEIWNPNKVYTAFTNYANNRRKNIFTAENPAVGIKSGYCAIRVLHNLIVLLRDGTFSLEPSNKEILEILKAVKNGELSTGEIIDYSFTLEKVAQAHLHNCTHTNNPDLVMKYYNRMRKKYWS